MDDAALMDLALSEAAAALEAGEVPVGCVFAHPARGVIGRGRNNTVASRNGTRHAELEAIDRMLDVDGVPPESVAECTLYVTVEPCLMCASALRQLRVSRVVFGAANDKFGGCGSVLSLHADGGASAAGDPPYPAVGGVRKAEAVALLRLFYAIRAGEPECAAAAEAHAQAARARRRGGEGNAAPARERARRERTRLVVCLAIVLFTAVHRFYVQNCGRRNTVKPSGWRAPL